MRAKQSLEGFAYDFSQILLSSPPSPPYHQLFVRDNNKQNREQLIWRFLKYYKINVHYYVSGHHPESGNTPHRHQHLVLDKPLPSKSPPLQVYKRWLEKECLKDHLPEPREMSMSIKSTCVDPAENVRFLQYPAKEGIVYSCKLPPEITVSELCARAQAEHAAAQQFEKKADEAKAKAASVAGKLFQYLDIKKPTNVYKCVLHTLEFYRDPSGNEDPPHAQMQVRSAEKYAFVRGIWTNEEIMKRYCPEYRSTLPTKKEQAALDWVKHCSLTLNEQEELKENIVL